uniref:Uncharacterized protein n=1 Tax=Octopus bimaculoides TaxID=37653 RepID=A0A0L8I1P0_OCTBM
MEISETVSLTQRQTRPKTMLPVPEFGPDNPRRSKRDFAVDTSCVTSISVGRCYRECWISCSSDVSCVNVVRLSSLFHCCCFE